MAILMVEIKLNLAYRSAHESNARYRVIYCVAGSKKAQFVVKETLLNMLSSSSYSYLVVRKTSKSIRNSVFRLLVEMISEFDIAEYFRINKTDMTITCATGSSLITSGLDDVEKLKSVANINRVWVEEA